MLTISVLDSDYTEIKNFTLYGSVKTQTDTGWLTKCHTIDCKHNTFLFLQKHLTSGTELILIGWKIVS